MCPVEIMFIVDSSEKARGLLFERQKDFVLRFSTRLAQLHSTGWRLRLRLAVIQYSSTVSVEHNFRDWQDLDVFQGRVTTMTLIGHGTYSAYAIANATRVFSRETSSSSLRVLLLLTDAADHPRSPSAVTAAAEAKQHNIRLFAIRTSGPAADGPMSARLRSIASAPPQQHVVSLTDSHLDDRLFSEMVSLIHLTRRMYYTLFSCSLLITEGINASVWAFSDLDCQGLGRLTPFSLFLWCVFVFMPTLDFAVLLCSVPTAKELPVWERGTWPLWISSELNVFITVIGASLPPYWTLSYNSCYYLSSHSCSLRHLQHKSSATHSVVELTHWIVRHFMSRCIQSPKCFPQYKCSRQKGTVEPTAEGKLSKANTEAPSRHYTGPTENSLPHLFPQQGPIRSHQALASLSSRGIRGSWGLMEHQDQRAHV